MQARVVGMVAAFLALGLLAPPGTIAQTPSPPPTSDQPPPLITPAQIDQLVAPIALYPDPLLSQILMAASYPVEVVEADRWRQDPANAGLQGDELAARLDAQTWDPSVKSLVPFPQILAMMDGNLVWTERLGEAFIAQPAEVMDEVQRLRREASADGRLGSNAREVVNQADGDITIQPADPSDVDAPEYDPETVYGTWPYPEYPPYYFPDYFSDCAIGEFGYCWTVWPIVLPLWGWDHWDWRHHQINIDHDRFARLDQGRNPLASGVWRHDPAHRLGAPYQAPAVRSTYAAAAGSESERRAVRGYEPAVGPRTAAPSAGRSPPMFESYGSGANVRAEAERGEASRAQLGSFGGAGFGSRGVGGISSSRGFGGAAAGGRRR
jgi:Protein of unknown function (DUF3300)